MSDLDCRVQMMEGSTFTLINIVSSLRKCRFFSISCDTKRGKPKPNESGSLLGR
ncbi:hypothetical protein L798_07736 [Zootermopsis nevadensis]|uniref:Uncharacterized protein n=1 Tax=Zootermopsis nevadensis TaxID=136037 RepID=A0A067RG68_ZOONE|nr:hypothetical protein L798_07736 [Zootermopsis nevadensis]